MKLKTPDIRSFDREDLETIVERIIDHTFREDDGSLNLYKEQSGADYLDAVICTLEAHGLVEPEDDGTPD